MREVAQERVRFRYLLSGLGGDRVALLSTHIVEDVAQISRNFAVLARGRTLFAGTISALIEEANGKVFEVETNGKDPEDHFTVVATLHSEDVTSYQVVGGPPSYLETHEVSPSLEDGYVWLMRTESPPSAMYRDEAEVGRRRHSPGSEEGARELDEARKLGDNKA